MYCSECGAGIPDDSEFCPECGGQLKAGVTTKSQRDNRSAGEALPAELKGKWNWGGFLLTPFWGIGNRVWIALIAFAGFIPIIGWIVALGVAVYIGMKGNELAWQSKQWNSVEHFKEVQRKWAIAGLVVVVLSFFLGVVGAMLDPAIYY